MSKMVLAVLLAGLLCFFTGQCGSTNVQRPENHPVSTATPERSSLVLTDKNPTGSFSFDPSQKRAGAEILELTVTKVVNPSMTPVTISVSLVVNGDAGTTDSKKVKIGDFTLYPPDRPGKFMLSATPVWFEVSKRSKEAKYKIVVDMERADKTKPWTSIAVEFKDPELKSTASGNDATPLQ